MPQDLFVPVEKTTTTVENVGVTVREISMYFADNKTAGVLNISLAPKDANGNWREDVTPVLVQITDDLEATQPLKRYAASAFEAFLLYDANHPLVAALAAAMNARGLDIMSMTKADAAKAMLPAYLPQPEVSP